MTNFLDIDPEPRKVPTHKYGELKVTGLTISGIAFLIKRHPELFKVFNPNDKSMKLEMQQIIDLGEAVIADFLASGLGFPGNDKAVEKCRGMNPEDTWTIGEAIIDESFPGGAANFFEKVAKAAKENNLIQVSKVQQVKDQMADQAELKEAS